jgi:hypothetical protein
VGGPNEVGAAVLLLLYSQRKHRRCLVALKNVLSMF